MHNTFRVIWSFGGQFLLFFPSAELFLEIKGFFLKHIIDTWHLHSSRNLKSSACSHSKPSRGWVRKWCCRLKIPGQTSFWECIIGKGVWKPVFFCEVRSHSEPENLNGPTDVGVENRTMTQNEQLYVYIMADPPTGCVTMGKTEPHLLIFEIRG